MIAWNNKDFLALELQKILLLTLYTKYLKIYRIKHIYIINLLNG